MRARRLAFGFGMAVLSYVFGGSALAALWLVTFALYLSLREQP